MNFIKIILSLLVVLVPLISWPSSGVLEKKLDKSLFFDRVYQSDYFYFLSGDPDTKVNFSFGFELSRSHQVDFEYNQTMFWELNKNSKPFRDVNFNPKIVKRFQLGELLLDIGAYEHHSNGTDGARSRSYDCSYLYPKYIINISKVKIYLGAQSRFYYRLDKNNQDIEDYLGHFELSVASTFYLSHDKKEAIKLNLSSSPGGVYKDLYQYGYNKIDLIYDPSWNDFPINIHAQIFNGYGESLLNYNKKDTSYRIGISL